MRKEEYDAVMGWDPWFMTGRDQMSPLQPQKEIQQLLHVAKKELVLMLLHARDWGPAFDLTLPREWTVWPSTLSSHQKPYVAEGAQRKFLRRRLPACLQPWKERTNLPRNALLQGNSTTHVSKRLYIKCWIQFPPHLSWKQKCFSFWVDFCLPICLSLKIQNHTQGQDWKIALNEKNCRWPMFMTTE